jgi:dihydrofolate reductase
VLSLRQLETSMKTIYYTAATLDGFLADEHHSLEWLFQFQPPEGEDHYNAFIQHVGALAMGSSTYEWLLRHHVFPEDPSKAPDPWFYKQPTWVFSSRSLRDVPGEDIRFVQGDVRPVHAAMLEAARAAGNKDLWLVGGGELAGQFYDAGLLDELVVTIASVTLGQGKPLLPRRIVTPPLKLTYVRQHGEGFAALKYAVPKPQ